MTYEVFSRLAQDMMDEIPEEFTTGLQGVHVLEHARREEAYIGVYRMGEYLDPGMDHFLGGNPGLGRHIALYYGSFVMIARGNPEFDWEEELWKVLTHELRHHVESRAGDDSLIREDKKRDNYFKKYFKRSKS